MSHEVATTAPQDSGESGLGRRPGEGAIEPGWRPYVSLACCAAGLAVSVYLTYLHYAPRAISCPLGGSGGLINCEKVLTSSQSVLAGIPIPFFGLAFFAAMAAMSLPVAWRSTSIWIARARVASVAVAMVMVLYLVSQEALSLHAICIWCTSVHLVTFALFLIVITGWERTGWASARYGRDPD